MQCLEGEYNKARVAKLFLTSLQKQIQDPGNVHTQRNRPSLWSFFVVFGSKRLTPARQTLGSDLQTFRRWFYTLGKKKKKNAQITKTRAKTPFPVYEEHLHIYFKLAGQLLLTRQSRFG